MADGAPKSTGEFFRVITRPSASIIELTLPEFIDLIDFDRLTDDLLLVLDRSPAHRWVVDLAGVSYMGSAMLGLMVNIRQRIRGTRGMMVLCQLSPRLQELFRASSLERLFDFARTRDEAMRLVE